MHYIIWIILKPWIITQGNINLQNKKSPLLNIYGGKITTYRKLSEKVIEMLDPYLSIKKNKKWTDSKSL